MDVDARVSQAYYAQVPGSLPSNNSAGSISYSFPCNATLPDLTLNIGNDTAIYRAKILTFNNADAKNSKPPLFIQFSQPITFFPSPPCFLLGSTDTGHPQSVHRTSDVNVRGGRRRREHGRAVFRVPFRGVQPRGPGDFVCAVEWHLWIFCALSEKGG